MSKYTPTRLTRYDDESIIAEIKRVIISHFSGAIPTTSEFNKYSKVKAVTIIKRLGSWKNAVVKAGFKYESNRINRNDLINDLKQVLEKNGNEYFTLEFYEKHGRHSSKTVKKVLGYSKWDELLSAILSVKKYYKLLKQKINSVAEPRPSRSELVEDLRRAWETLGKRPSWTEYKEHGHFSISRYENEFGTWVNAIEHCIKVHDFKIEGSSTLHSTSQILLADIKAIASANNLSSIEFKKYREFGGSYSIGTFQNTFGSWRKACGEAGLRPGRSLIYSDDEFFDEIQRLWELLGGEPKAREIKIQSSISFNAFVKRFGSHSKTIHAFCIDRENSGSPDIPQERLTIPELEINIIKSGEQAVIGYQAIKMTTPRFPSKRLRFIVLNRDNFVCVKCGHGPKNCPETKLHIDHIIPYSKGGETIAENLQTLCSACNLGKSDLLL